jgi:prolipoprotein diacylglyceryltransferase
MLLAGLIGARLTYTILYPGAFIHNPVDIISRSPGLLDPSGGLALAAIAGLIYGQKKGLPLWQTLDTLTPGSAALAICLGISHLASGSAFGIPTQLPWGIYLWGDYRHPTQVYEIILYTLLFIFIVFTINKWQAAKPGMLFLVFLASSAVIHLIVEAFRADSLLLMDSFRTVQLIAWIILALSLWGIQKRIPEKGKVNRTAYSQKEVE